MINTPGLQGSEVMTMAPPKTIPDIHEAIPGVEGLLCRSFSCGKVKGNRSRAPMPNSSAAHPAAIFP